MRNHDDAVTATEDTARTVSVAHGNWSDRDALALTQPVVNVPAITLALMPIPVTADDLADLAALLRSRGVKVVDVDE